MEHSAQEPQEPQETSPSPENAPKKRRVRTGRKRTVFEKPPRPAWPVRGLWESAPQADKERAHVTCMAILEYWLGKKSKAEVAEALEVTPLRVWQLSQQALSGMMAGLLTQPRRRVDREVFEGRAGPTREALKKRIAGLEKELSRTEDLVRVLRTAPWAQSDSETTSKGGGPSHGGKQRAPRGAKKDRKRGAAPNRSAAQGGRAPAAGAGGTG